MKIINIDNYNRENRSDYLVCDNCPEYYAPKIAEFLNEKFGGEHSDNYFRAVPEDYKLYKFEP